MHADGLPNSQAKLTSQVHSPRGRGRVAWFAVSALFAGIVLAVLYVWWPPGNPPDEPPLPDLAQLNEDPDVPIVPLNPGYLGANACRACHTSRVAEFQKTPHALACRRPHDGPMAPGFDPGRGHYATPDPGLRFQMTREGGEYFQTAFFRESGTTQQSRSRIDLVYGANKADEVFFSWRGDRLYELVTAWLHPSGEWANTLYNRYGAGHFARDATARCLECHNTWFAHVPGTTNQYQVDSFVLGVSCEKCHGPGKQHVEFHRDHPTAKEPRAIVHPGHLDRERLIEVCTQCHGNWIKARGPGNSYRPGEPIEKYYRLAMTEYPEEDHVANQIKYLRQSKCFQKSDSMTCVTCHDPHRPHGRTDPAVAHKSCTQCHKPEACTDRPNLPAAVRDDCVGCHMRKRVWMNVHFHTPADQYTPAIQRYQHQISRDRTGRSEVLLAWHRGQPGEAHRQEAEKLVRELAEHWQSEVDRCRRGYRFLGAIGAARELLRLPLPEQLRQSAESAKRDLIATQARLDADLNEAFHAADINEPGAAIETLNKILVTKPNWAVARSKLGTLYAATGRTDLAQRHLAAVAADDPDNASGLVMLGWLAYLDGRADTAADYYRRASDIEPRSAKINYQWGLALVLAERWAEAGERFREATVIDPGHAGAWNGLAEVDRRLGRPADAVRHAWRAARLSGFDDVNSLITLAASYHEAGRSREAAAAAARAIEIDESGRARLPVEARHRMNDFRSRARPAAR